MEDDMDIQPTLQSPPDESNKDKKDPIASTASKDPKSKPTVKSSVPLYEHLIAEPPSGKGAAENAHFYVGHLANVPGFPWHHESKDPNPVPVFAAPYITGGDAEALTEAQLRMGIYINIPRSSKLWFGDHLKLRWGQNTFYTTVSKVEGRDGPRQVQYLNNEALGDYESGRVEVRYEIVRRTKLVGISETLTVNLPRQSKRRSKTSPPGRPPRRRRVQPKP
jgi:hypothetical protein